MAGKAVPSFNFWQTFAEGLAQLHSITNTSYGWRSFNYIGTLHQSNNSTSSWASFYGTQRIIPLVKKLFDAGSFSKADVADAEKLCDNLPNIFPGERPSLVHGDLWAGNFMAVESGKSVLPSIYDPAVYYGHREMDIGMSLLFGGFNSQFYEAYNSFHRLEAGWQERVTLTQLYPLLVHAVLFGGGIQISVKQLLVGGANKVNATV